MWDYVLNQIITLLSILVFLENFHQRNVTEPFLLLNLLVCEQSKFSRNLKRLYYELMEWGIISILFHFILTTGCSLDIVFFLKILLFFWTLQVRYSDGVLSAWCVYTHWHRGNTEKGRSPEYFKIFEKQHNIKWTSCSWLGIMELICRTGWTKSSLRERRAVSANIRQQSNNMRHEATSIDIVFNLGVSVCAYVHPSIKCFIVRTSSLYNVHFQICLHHIFNSLKISSFHLPNSKYQFSAYSSL